MVSSRRLGGLPAGRVISVLLIRRFAEQLVPTHIDARRGLLHRAVSHLKRLRLGQFLASGHHDRHWPASRDPLEALGAVVRFHKLRS